MTDKQYISKNILGKKLKIARAKKSLKQLQLAKEIGVSPNYISLIENGQKIPSLKIIGRIAEALSVSTSSLLAEDPIMDDLKSLSEKYDLQQLASALHNLIVEKSKSLI